MIGALWTAASGLQTQRIAVDGISNNVANVNTTGFKKNETQFQDLFYQHANALGEFEPDNSSRTGISIGTGAKIAGTEKVFSQGRLEQTGNPLDLAIDGEGFFRVLLPDGTAAYTRDGAFTADVTGRIVTPQGYRLEPSITIPQGAKSLNIAPNGEVSVMLAGLSTPSAVGTITLYRVGNPNGLLAIGENLFKPTDAAGSMIEVGAGSPGVGSLAQGFVEGSNVELADEMTRLVVAQRAYEFNARAFRTADEMLSIATNIRG